MLFVILKREFEHAISIARDDRLKKSQGRAGPYLRLEANSNFVKLEGLEASAQIPATVYEPGVLFLQVTLFRRVLRAIRGEKFLTIQATADELIVDKVRLPLEANAMLMYADPDLAPNVYPTQSPAKKNTKSESQQLLFWPEITEKRP